MTAAVVDNTLLSNFAHIQQPKLLEAAFDRSVTVRTVMDELEVGVQTTRIPSVDWSWLPVIELTDDEHAMAKHLNQTLGRGEAACIALAKSRQWICSPMTATLAALRGKPDSWCQAHSAH